MIKIIFILVALFTTSLVQAQRLNMTMELEGHIRSFIVVVPTGVAPAGGFPVVFMLHGTSGDGEKFFNISGWKELVQPQKLIAVFPSSLEWCVNDDNGPGTNRTTKWVNGDLLDQACPGQTFVDDVRFFRKMVDTLQTFALINTRRVFASGFSNGGLMTSKLAVDASDVFAAVAASAGPLHALDSLMPTKSIPTWFTIGSKDDRFTGPAGVAEIPLNDSCLLYMGGMINRYLGAYGLTYDYTRSETPLTLTYTFKTPQVGASPALFIATLVKGLFHQYPNGENFPIKAADVFWEFFNTVSGPTSVEGDEGTTTWTLYPNPAHTSLSIATSERELGSDVVVVNALGVAVATARVQSPHVDINIGELPSGVYYARIGTSTQTFHIVR